MLTPISKPGCYDIPAAAYHADPCRTPSLSRSLAVTLLTRTAKACWTQHPKLNPGWKPELKAAQKKRFDIGSVAHSIMLNDKSEICVVRSPDFKGFAAQRKRDFAYEAGQIPVLEGDLINVQRMVAAGRAQLAGHENASNAFLEGKPEQTLVCKEKVDGVWVWLRVRPDWLPPLGGWLDDYKTCEGSSEPEAWTNRNLYPEGLDIQAAMYCRVYKAVFGVAPAGFRFVVQTTEEPWELSTVVLAPGDFDLATRELERAISLWAWCIKHDRWPGHPARDCYVMRSAWREKSILEREDRDQFARQGGADLRARALEWQAPLPGTKGRSPKP